MFHAPEKGEKGLAEWDKVGGRGEGRLNTYIVNFTKWIENVDRGVLCTCNACDASKIAYYFRTVPVPAAEQIQRSAFRTEHKIASLHRYSQAQNPILTVYTVRLEWTHTNERKCLHTKQCIDVWLFAGGLRICGECKHTDRIWRKREQIGRHRTKSVEP